MLALTTLGIIGCKLFLIKIDAPVSILIFMCVLENAMRLCFNHFVLRSSFVYI